MVPESRDPVTFTLDPHYVHVLHPQTQSRMKAYIMYPAKKPTLVFDLQTIRTSSAERHHPLSEMRAGLFIKVMI